MLDEWVVGEAGDLFGVVEVGGARAFPGPERVCHDDCNGKRKPKRKLLFAPLNRKNSMFDTHVHNLSWSVDLCIHPITFTHEHQEKNVINEWQ